MSPPSSGQTKTPGTEPPAFPIVQVAVSGLLIVVEAALARFVIALAARAVGRTLVTTCRPADLAATAIETAASRRRTAGEVGAPIAHRAAVAGAAVTTAATAALATTTTAVAAATAAAIATATAAAVAAATTPASAVGRTRTARTEAAAITAATATESAAATTGE